MIDSAVVRDNGHKFRKHVLGVSHDATGCIFWNGPRDKDGYGLFQFRSGGQKFKCRAHRAAYVLSGCRLFPGDVLRHTCDNPACVNPEHLVVGTHADNVKDRVDKGRSACGSANGRASLSETQVGEIRREAARLIMELAERYGVDRKSIRLAIAQQTWKNV